MEPQIPSSTTPPVIEILSFVSRNEEYPGVFTYTFHPAHPITFHAGQYAHVRLLSLPEDTRRVREFSFASAPSDEYIVLGIDSRSGSDYQRALAALTPGDTVELFKIKSHMTWPPPQPDVVMIAGGIGITPFRSMLLDAKGKQLSFPTTVVHVSSGAFLYKDELTPLAKEYSSIARPLITETLDQIIKEHPLAHYYIAGSAGFVQTINEHLTDRGITMIESDEFKGLHDED